MHYCWYLLMNHPNQGWDSHDNISKLKSKSKYRIIGNFLRLYDLIDESDRQKNEFLLKSLIQ
jgi:hypothetical protein